MEVEEALAPAASTSAFSASLEALAGKLGLARAAGETDQGELHALSFISICVLPCMYEYIAEYLRGVLFSNSEVISDFAYLYFGSF
jgi:hypothetical protein